MARTFTRADIRNQVRELIGMELGDASDPDNDFIDDTELNRKINASLAVWHGKVAKAVPERYEAEQTITANGATSYALPADFLWDIGVDFELTENCRVGLRRIMVQERNLFDASINAQAEGYRIKGATTVLLPTPDSGTYYLVYVTCAPTLSSDATTVDGVNGWEKWIVYDVALDCRIKEESDISGILAAKAAIEKEMADAAAERSAGQPSRVVDTRTGRWDRQDPDFWAGR